MPDQSNTGQARRITLAQNGKEALSIPSVLAYFHTGMSVVKDRAGWGAGSRKGIFVGGGGADHRLPQTLAFEFGNRHGLIAGATGTGKTITMQILAEEFARAGSRCS